MKRTIFSAIIAILILSTTTAADLANTHLANSSSDTESKVK